MTSYKFDSDAFFVEHPRPGLGRLGVSSPTFSDMPPRGRPTDAGAISRAILEKSPLLVYLVGLDMSVAMVNRRLRDVTGYDLTDCPDVASLLELFYPQQRYREVVERIHDGWSRNEHIRGQELLVHTRAQGVRTISWSTSRLKNRKGVTVGYIAMGVDLTEQRQVEQWARLQTAALDSLESGVVLTAMNGQILYWSAGATRLLGHGADERKGQQLSEMLTDATVLQRVDQSVAESGSFEGLAEFQHNNGGRVRLQLRDLRLDNEKGQALARVAVLAPPDETITLIARADQLETQLRERESELARRSEEFLNAEQRLSALGALEAELNETRASLAAAQQGGEEQSQELKEQLAASREQLGLQEQEAEAARAQAEELQADVERLTRSLEEAQAAVVAAGEERTRLESGWASERGAAESEAQAAVQELEAEVARAEEAVGAVESQLAERTGELAISRSQVERLEGELSELRAARDGLQQQVEAAESRHAELAEQVASLEGGSAATPTAHAATIAALTTELKDTRSASTERQSELEASLGQVRDELSGAQEELERLRSELAASQAQAGELEGALAENQSELASERERLAAAESARAELQAEHERELEALKASLGSASEGQDEARAGLEEAQAGLSEAQAGLEEARTGLAEAQAELEQARSGLSEARQSEERLEAELRASREQVEGLQDQLLVAAQANDDLRPLLARVAELEQDLAESRPSAERMVAQLRAELARAEMGSELKTVAMFQSAVGAVTGVGVALLGLDLRVLAWSAGLGALSGVAPATSRAGTVLDHLSPEGLDLERLLATALADGQGRGHGRLGTGQPVLVEALQLGSATGDPAALLLFVTPLSRDEAEDGSWAPLDAFTAGAARRLADALSALTAGLGQGASPAQRAAAVDALPELMPAPGAQPDEPELAPVVVPVEEPSSLALEAEELGGESDVLPSLDAGVDFEEPEVDLLAVAASFQERVADDAFKGREGPLVESEDTDEVEGLEGIEELAAGEEFDAEDAEELGFEAEEFDESAFDEQGIPSSIAEPVDEGSAELTALAAAEDDGDDLELSELELGEDEIDVELDVELEGFEDDEE